MTIEEIIRLFQALPPHAKVVRYCASQDNGSYQEVLDMFFVVSKSDPNIVSFQGMDFGPMVTP